MQSTVSNPAQSRFFPVEVVDRPAFCVCSSLEPLKLCLDRDGGLNGQRDAALVLRQVLPLNGVIGKTRCSVPLPAIRRFC
jgi:hypothetical protein